MGEAEIVLQRDATHAADRRHARVDEQTVYLVLAQARVGDGALDGLGREVLRVVAVYASHLGDAQAGDGRFGFEFASVHAGRL